jgi:hypothetical protein
MTAARQHSSSPRPRQPSRPSLCISVLAALLGFSMRREPHKQPQKSTPPPPPMWISCWSCSASCPARHVDPCTQSPMPLALTFGSANPLQLELQEAALMTDDACLSFPYYSGGGQEWFPLPGGQGLQGWTHCPVPRCPGSLSSHLCWSLPMVRCGRLGLCLWANLCGPAG